MKTPAFAVEFKPVESLVPYAKNARTHSPKQLLMLARSLVEFGWTNPVLVDKKGIIAGHGRVLAAQVVWDHGVEVAGGQRVHDIANVPRGQIPTVTLGSLTEQQRKAYIIADNKLAEAAGWDTDLLAMELGELFEDGFNLTLTGFSTSEISSLIGDGPTTGHEDDAPSAPAIPTSRRGDLWHLGEHIVLCGDSLDPSDYATLLRDGPANVLWTDPPYNVGYESQPNETRNPITRPIINDDMSDAEYRKFLTTCLQRAFGGMVDGAAVYLCHADVHGSSVRESFAAAGFKLSSCLIWIKDHLVLGRSDYQWRHEPILYGWKPGAAHVWLGGRKQTSVLEMADKYSATQLADGTTQVIIGDNVLSAKGDVELEELQTSIFREDRPKVSTLHPTMKPVALIERHLKNHCVPGEVVLDIFAGSGSTVIACERLGLRGRMMEITPEYVDVIIQRWQGYTKKIARLEDGRPYDEVKAIRGTAAA